MVKPIVKFFFVVAAVVLYPPLLSAQRGPLTEGDKVKIAASTNSEKPLNGHVLHISDTDLSINSGGLYYFYPFHSIDRIERSIGKKRNTKRGMIIGGISGSLVIGLIEWASYKPCQQTGMWSCLYYPENSGTALGQGLVTGAILGGSAGGIIGTFWKTDVWQRVPLPVQFYQASIHHQGLQKQVAGITVRFPVKTNKNVYKGNR